MAASPSFVQKRIDSAIVGDAWHETPVDIADIGADASRLCQEELETVKHTRVSRSVLLHGAPGSGKTHLFFRMRRHIEDKNRAAWLDSIFVYVRMQTAPGQIWRHIRRQLVQDLLRRSDSGPSQFERLIFRRLAAPGSGGGALDKWKRELSEASTESGDPLARALYAITNYLERNNGYRELREEIFERLDAPVSLDRSFEKVIEKLIRRERVSIAEAWLKGELLSEADLSKIGLPTTTEDDDPEGKAREAVFQLLRLIGPGTPVAICFDQIEALQSDTEDISGFFAFGSAAGALRDMPENTLIVSCIQSKFIAQLPGVLGANYDRISGRLLELPGITKVQAKALVEARGGVWKEERFADLFASTGRATARAVIQCAMKPNEEKLEDVWEREFDAALKGDTESSSDEILEHGLPLLLQVSNERKVNRSGSRDLQFTATGGGPALGFSICNQRNAVALAARLRRLRNEMLPPRQIIMVRDARLPIPLTARKANEHLHELTGAGARLVRPSVEAIAAVNALRILLSNAQAGDLVLNGQTVPPASVEEWLKEHLPRDLESLAGELLDRKQDEHVELHERLLDLLSREHLVEAKRVAEELGTSETAIARCAQQRTSRIGYLSGPPALLFEASAGAGN